MISVTFRAPTQDDGLSSLAGYLARQEGMGSSRSMARGGGKMVVSHGRTRVRALLSVDACPSILWPCLSPTSAPPQARCQGTAPVSRGRRTPGQWSGRNSRMNGILPRGPAGHWCSHIRGRSLPDTDQTNTSFAQNRTRKRGPAGSTASTNFSFSINIQTSIPKDDGIASREPIQLPRIQGTQQMTKRHARSSFRLQTCRLSQVDPRNG